MANANDKVNFLDVGAIAQALKFQIRSGKQWDDLTPAAKESLDQIATLIARIVSGESSHWDTIASYAQAAKPEIATTATLEIERNIRALVREIRPNPDGAA